MSPLLPHRTKGPDVGVGLREWREAPGIAGGLPTSRSTVWRQRGLISTLT
ncbi:hypothetical protein [Streptomyces sp. NRRL F-2664]|nr:hypothetical protein [Streptomyces sp. NRRL F-2664]